VTRRRPTTDEADLLADLVDIDLDQKQIYLLRAIAHLIVKGNRDLMALIDDINTAVAKTGADAKAAGERAKAAILAAIAAASDQIAALAAQVQALIDGNASDITPEQLQAVLDGVNEVDATVSGIAPDAAPPV
jgi:hypothetical protein